MSKKSRSDLDKLLHQYFRKNTESFYRTIKKAGLIASEKDIHSARVDLKKVFALISFFELIGVEELAQSSLKRYFRKIYRASGRLRDHQLMITRAKLIATHKPEFKPFVDFAKKGLRRSFKQYIHVAVHYEGKNVKKANKMVEGVCKTLTKEQIEDRCFHFLQSKRDRIALLLNSRSSTDSLHAIRKELKSIGALVPLLKVLTIELLSDTFIELISRTEKSIGDWHDDVVFHQTILDFIGLHQEKSVELASFLVILTTTTAEIATQKEQNLLPEIQNIVDQIGLIKEPSRGIK